MKVAANWETAGGKERICCPCGKPLAEVAPDTVAKFRERPEARRHGDRNFTIRCKDCRREVDILLEIAN